MFPEEETHLRVSSFCLLWYNSIGILHKNKYKHGNYQ